MAAEREPVFPADEPQGVRLDELERRMLAHMTPELVRNEQARMIAEAIGVEAMIKVAKLIGGTRFYYPQADKLLRPARDRCIREDFDGWNYGQLAVKYGLTDKAIRDICGKGQVVGQITLDDCRDGQDKEID